jgi:hypothetical protein
MNRENNRFLPPEAENQQHFFAFVPPSSGITLAIYYTLYGLCQLRPLDGWTNATKMLLIFNLNPCCCLDIYSALYFYLCISVG